MKLENKATIISSITAFILVIVKLITGFLTSSMAIFSTAIDSLLDMTISLCNYYILKTSQNPINNKYNFGFGKLQGFGALIESLIILFSGLFLIIISLWKISTGNYDFIIDISIYVMIFSILVTLGLVNYLNKVVKKTQNIVIKADLMHYNVDLISNSGILLSLIIIRATGWLIIDPIISIIIAFLIIIGSMKIFRQGFDMLMDRSLNEDDLKIIKKIICSSDKKVLSYHNLKTRQSGDTKHIQFHLVFIEGISLFDAHEIGKLIEKNILNHFNNSNIIIHLDPYDDK